MSTVSECKAWEHPGGLWTLVAERSASYIIVGHSYRDISRWATENGWVIIHHAKTSVQVPGGLPVANGERP